ncbi:MAG: hypothetical protein R2733_07480 [Acidimicrobiales bacterium]
MTELEDQLTGMLHQQAGNVRVEDRLDAIINHTGTVSPAPARQRHRLVFAGAAVLLAVAGAVAIREVGDTPRSAPSAGDTTSTTESSTTSTTDAATPTSTTLATATTAAPATETDCLPTFRFKDVQLDPPVGVTGRDLVFSAEIVRSDGVPFLQTRVLEAPEGTAIIEILVNGHSEGGGSYLPGTVQGSALGDESTAIVELCAYGSDYNLIVSKRYDEELPIE